MDSTRQHSSVEGAGFEDATYRKIALKLLPILFAGYFLAILDRVNVGFAKLQMASDLALSDAVYGFGAGIFFIGYFLFELPSNLILSKVGARAWIARIMVTWGLLSVCFMFTGSVGWGGISAWFGTSDAEFTFYLLRFTLGIAEAGFFPGVILYLTFWFPAARRAHVVALFLIAIPMASAVGSPISGLILQFADGMGNLRGWQWLFLIEGIPAVLLGLAVLKVLPNGPRDAAWLADQERDLVESQLAADEVRKHAVGMRHDFSAIFLDWRIWALALADFSRGIINNALNFWMPTLVQEIGIDRANFLKVGLVSAIPWSIAAVAMVIVARNSDRTGERRWHATASLLVSMIGLLMLAFGGGSVVVSILALTLVASGAMAWLAVFWTIPTAFLSGVAAAGGIAWINALSQLGGFVGPDMLGRIREGNDGDGTLAFLVMAGIAIIGAALTFVLAKQAEGAKSPT
ncbi:MFS transporter [Alteraurantiacibacter aestuarii]|uniref:MFS transporter n=1 Tax=Alteraurantiacibacter aestuarii TaxID=650004 RepID=A0A844ZLA0_9SPHN|nr:MFS transporter [Alteraurantiacibacter aestuarii]MXO87637.1 MFS transporter [Alteraurantiacibacter aestuarii]